MTVPDLAAERVFDELLRQLDWLLPGEDAADRGVREYADVVSDLLGFLARRMTALHEQRQDEVASFLEWLEERIGCAIDDLAGKTYVFEYYDQPEGVTKLLSVLEKNHPAVVALDVSQPRTYGARNEDRELIVAGYERSMSRLNPLLRQLELTDRLIDLVVYRFYGLTEEEARLVDEATGYVAGSR